MNSNLLKNEQIKKLFDENREKLLSADITTPVKQNGICFDGIIDEEEFDKCAKKVIFLLKETNGNSTIKSDDGTNKTGLPEALPDWDYRKWLQEQQAYGYESYNGFDSSRFYGFTFNKICMWVDVFCDCLSGVDESFDDYKKSRYNETNFRNILRRIGVVNLKKTWGSASTKWSDLYSYLHQENNKTPLDVLRKEIEIIKPDIVICGGEQVFDFAQEIFCGEVCSMKVTDGTRFRYFKNEDMVFLDFYHPSCRKSIQKSYNYAKMRFNVIKQIL